MARHCSTRELFQRGLFGDLDFPVMKETQPEELLAA